MLGERWASKSKEACGKQRRAAMAKTGTDPEVQTKLTDLAPLREGEALGLHVFSSSPMWR